MSQNAQSTVDIEPSLTLTSVSESDAGEYVCAATNDLGSTYSEPIVVDVTCKNLKLIFEENPRFCSEDREKTICRKTRRTLGTRQVQVPNGCPLDGMGQVDWTMEGAGRALI